MTTSELTTANEPYTYEAVVTETRTYRLKIWASDDAEAESEARKYYRFERLGNQKNLESNEVSVTAQRLPRGRR